MTWLLSAVTGSKLFQWLAIGLIILAVLFGLERIIEKKGRLEERERTNEDRIRGIRLRQGAERETDGMKPEDRRKWLRYGGPK